MRSTGSDVQRLLPLYTLSLMYSSSSLTGWPVISVSGAVEFIWKTNRFEGPLCVVDDEGASAASVDRSSRNMSIGRDGCRSPQPTTNKPHWVRSEKRPFQIRPITQGHQHIFTYHQHPHRRRYPHHCQQQQHHRCSSPERCHFHDSVYRPGLGVFSRLCHCV